MSGKKESRVNYKELFDTMTEGFALHEIVYDENGEPHDYRFLEVNPAFEHITGMKKDEVLGGTYREILPNDESSCIRACSAVSLTGEPIKLEHYSRDLKRFYNIVVYRPAPGQIATLFMDISERKRIEEDLLKSEVRSRAILDSIPDQVFHIEEDGTILDYRAPANLDFYVRPDAFLGKKMEAVLPPDLVTQVTTHMKQAQETGVTQVLECGLEIGGKEIDFEARISVLLGGGFIVLVRDISERKRIDEALLESDRLFRAAVDSVPYFFVIYDRELRFRYANRAALERIGLSEEKIYSHTNEELFSPEIIEPYISHLRRALETKSVQRVEFTNDLASGMMTFFTIYVPLLNEKGDVIQVLGISQDITKKKEAERRLKSALEENREQNRLLKAAFEELSGNYKEIEQLLYKISHGLITPLITIDGFLGLLKKDVEKCNRIRIEIDLGLIGDAVSRMQNLLGDALELSSLGMLSRTAESISLKEIINEAREHFKNTSTSNHLVITEDEKFPQLYFNRTRMVDVLMSMIYSCISYSGWSSELSSAEGGQGPQVHVGWRKGDDGPVLFARCKGRGKQKDLEEAFRHCCEGESNDSSTTIGLAISKKIIELQGGRMWMECDPEAGCTILFSLPEAVNG